jgi:hypothetical protein
MFTVLVPLVVVVAIQAVREVALFAMERWDECVG